MTAIRPIAKAIKANLDISSSQLLLLGIDHRDTAKQRQEHELEKHRRILADMRRDWYRQERAQQNALPVAENA